jgi:DMSO/TMAO reductase YedYZ molybdopterin-dependent catalytic subunit
MVHGGTSLCFYNHIVSYKIMHLRSKLSNKRAQSSNTIVIAVLVLIIAGLAGYIFFNQQGPPPQENGDEPGLPEIPSFELIVVGADDENITLTQDDFSEMESVTMVGGLMTSAGSIKGPYNYTGVPLDKVLELVGGISEENSLRVTASDGYAMVFTWEEIKGDFVTFNPVTGDEGESEDELSLILAYHEDGEPLIEGHGPLRLVILGEEGHITEGHFWIKQVIKIEVISAIKEYTLSLEGAISEIMDRATFESGTNCPDTTPNHRGVYLDDEGQVWTGMPLWLLVGRIDDEIHHTSAAYNRDLADDNAYTVNVIAGDGYTVTLNGSFVKLNEDIVLANELDGAALPEPYWPLRLVGSDLTKGQMVRNVVKIQLVFNESRIPEPTVGDWNLTLRGDLTEIVSSSLFIEGVTCEEAEHEGEWSDPEGQTWTGIPVWLLLGRVDDENSHGAGAFNTELAEEGYQVEFIASDGYSVTLNSTQLMGNNDIILAYLVDGEPLPEDKMPLRLVGEGLRTGQMVYNLIEIKLHLE